MTPDEIREVVSRIDGIWPPRKPPTIEERQEWVRFLQPLDGPLMIDAIEGMKDALMFRPSMAEAKTHYHIAAAVPQQNALQLPAGGGKEEGPSLEDIYGSHQPDWIYCWRCDMAISLEERSGKPFYDEHRGLFHDKCPKTGAAPSMPVHSRIERQEYWTKHKITATP